VGYKFQKHHNLSQLFARQGEGNSAPLEDLPTIFRNELQRPIQSYPVEDISIAIKLHFFIVWILLKR